MEIAIGIVGAALGLLGVILAYIFRANHRYLQQLQASISGIAQMVNDVHEGQKEIAQIVKEIAQMVKDVHEGQREIVKLLSK
ncbi:MAG: hypothetical protein CO103_00165 [Chloroflexi bacterium CG_4_9_14_3_um_filter_45_9]|nr:MAG: hypothetical protein COZ67_01205 [Chloroflexi bacterium CG_4_8_14_3_um_filter_45_15]PJB51403.1 MAG: hypothetical protein CO103_00165 [Chloroflexi bacterium CG_4_9_14_3_um_filter_45_9]